MYLRSLQQQQSVYTRPTVKPSPTVYTDAVVHTAYLSKHPPVCVPAKRLNAGNSIANIHVTNMLIITLRQRYLACAVRVRRGCKRTQVLTLAPG